LQLLVACGAECFQVMKRWGEIRRLFVGESSVSNYAALSDSGKKMLRFVDVTCKNAGKELVIGGSQRKAHKI
jgi:hypothetical protein